MPLINNMRVNQIKPSAQNSVKFLKKLYIPLFDGILCLPAAIFRTELSNS